MSSSLSSFPELSQLQQNLQETLTKIKTKLAAVEKETEEALLELEQKGYKIDKDQIPAFIKHWWFTHPTKNPYEWEVAIPVFLPFNIGHWDRTEGGYNVFIINRYTQWFGEKIPSFINHEMNLPAPLDITLDGLNLKFPEGKQEQIEQKFGKHLSLIEKDHATVKIGNEFDLLAEIIDTGSLPFVPKPIAKEDLMESDFTQIYDELKNEYNPLRIFEGKYSFQGDAWNEFEKYGAIGIFWAMSFGKTVIGTYIFSRIKGPKALIVPSITLKEQWTEFFKRNCPRLLNEVEIFTYQGMSRKTKNFNVKRLGNIEVKGTKACSQSLGDICKKKYAVTGYDECHFLPADSFSKLATIETKYRFGLSATPYREDGRTNYIMALTGFPLGLDWRTIMKVLGKEYHTVNVHIVKDLEAKYALARQLYNPERRTLFFVFRLDIGNKLAEMFNLRFISGDTKEDRIELVKQNYSFIASKTLEHGLSIKDLEHIIEVDFHFGGRQEQVQRCLPPDEKIVTESAVFQMGDLCNGQTIFSKTGGTEVKEVFRRKYEGPLVKIKTEYFLPVRVSPEHPFFAVKGTCCKFKSKSKIKFCRLDCAQRDNYPKKCEDHFEWEPDWFPAEELTVGDWLTIPKIKFTEQDLHFDLSKYLGDNYNNRFVVTDSEIISVVNKLSIKRFVNFDSDLAFLFGWWLAEGSPIAGQGIKYCLGPLEELEAAFIKEKLKTVFAVDSTICPRIDLPTIEVVCYSSILERFFVECLGKYSEGKHLPEWAFKAKGVVMETLLLSYGKGDGYTRKNNLDIKSVSEDLVRQLQLICWLKLNRVAGIQKPIESKLEEINGHIYQTQKKYVLSARPKLRKHSFYEDKDYFYIPIKNVAKINYRGELVNLHTGDGHFCMPFMAHNSGRLMHSEAEEKIHDILMTKDELENYGKRLYALYEKGFRPRIIPHLAGIQAALEDKPKKTLKPKTSKDLSAVMNDMYGEGFFQAGRFLRDVSKEVQRRGISLNEAVNKAIFDKLRRMVSQKKLWKTKTPQGYEFKARNS